MNTAHELRRLGLTMSEALKTAWAKYKANRASKVTFKKKNGEVTTRRFATLNEVKLNLKGGKATPKTIKVIDLDKVDLGLALERCIISFNPSQVIAFN